MLKVNYNNGRIYYNFTLPNFFSNIGNYYNNQINWSRKTMLCNSTTEFLNLSLKQ